MAKKITELGASPALDDADLVVVVDFTDTTTKKATVAQIREAIGNHGFQPVAHATVAVLSPSPNAAGSGATKTLTGSSNAALSVDGVAVVAGERVLVKNQAAPADNGIYVVTAAGSGSAPYVLTRAPDANTVAKLVRGATVLCFDGTLASVNRGKEFFLDSAVATMESSAQVWTPQFTDNGVETLTYAASVALDFNPALPSLKLLSLTGNVILTSANLRPGAAIAVELLASGGARTLAFPVGWIFFGAAAPASLASGKRALLSVTSTTGVDAGCRCAYSAEP